MGYTNQHTGFGLFIPWVMLSIGWHRHSLVVFAVTYISCFFGAASAKTMGVGREIKNIY